MTEAALTRSQPKCMSPADNEVCFPRLTAGWNSVPVALHSFATRNSGLLPTVGKSEYHLESSTGECYFSANRQGQIGSRISASACTGSAPLHLDYSWGSHALKGHGFSRTVTCC